MHGLFSNQHDIRLQSYPNSRSKPNYKASQAEKKNNPMRSFPANAATSIFSRKKEKFLIRVPDRITPFLPTC